MKMFLLFTLLSFSVFADEICEATGSNAFEMPAELVHAMDAVELMQKAITPTQMENAFCKTHEVPEYDWWLENHGNDNRANRNVKGFNFLDQPTFLMDAFRDIVVNMPARNSSCTTVLCAVDEIWGSHIGRKILYIRARHGYNTSEFVFPNTRRFLSSELDDIMITLGDLPPEFEMIGQRGNQRMTLEGIGVTLNGDPTVIADSSIKFYDGWRNASKFRRRYGLFHEFGHNVSFIKGKLDSSPGWRALRSCPVSTYGNSNRSEDFAETFLMYRFNGPGLKQRCPEKYNFLRDNAFRKDPNSRTREYLDESQCY